MSSSQASTPLNSPQQTPSLPTQEVKKESIEDALSKPFKPLDDAAVISAFDTDSKLSSHYEADLNDMLLSAMLEVRAWALARPAAEQDATEDALTVELDAVRKTQIEQEQTRLRLLNFINSIKSALAALTTGI